MKNDVNGQMDLLDLLGIEKEVEQKPEKEKQRIPKKQKKLKMFQILLKYPKRKQKQKNINALS